MLNRVLILSASAGAGHVRAAAAIERAFSLSGAAREIVNVDVLNYTTSLFRRLYSNAYLEMVNKMPQAMGWIYDHLDKPWKNERRRLALDKLNTRPFVKLLHETRPDIVVSTHFLPSEIISWLKAKERVSFPQTIVVTDFDVHAMWLCRHYEQYFVAIDETRVHMEKLGVPASKLSVTGIPIDPLFREAKNKHEMRRKHDLAPDRTTILVSAGGFGVGKVDELWTSLADMQHEAQVVALCGRNEELQKRLERVSARQPANARVRLKSIGFTTAIDELMSAADILLGKPGGLTTSEALAKGLVFVIVNPIPGQEERNADHLLEQGVAIRSNNLPALGYKVDRLLDDQERFHQMKANALRMARPDAAFAVVNKIQELRQA